MAEKEYNYTDFVANQDNELNTAFINKYEALISEFDGMSLSTQELQVQLQQACELLRSSLELNKKLLAKYQETINN